MIDEGVCFSRHARLLKPDEYSRVFKKPVRSSDRFLTILAVLRDVLDDKSPETKQNDIKPKPRLGLAISKKNAKRAVDRNRIKRLVRESFRLHQHQLPPIDLVVMAKPVTKNAENQQIFQSLNQHWNKLVKDFQDKDSQKS